MEKTVERSTTAPWDIPACEALIAELWMLRTAMLEQQARLEPVFSQLSSTQRPSAINLAHYLALRRFELRPMQQRLSRMGVSSLGRAESHVMANLDKVLGILHRLAGREWAPHQEDEPSGIKSGEALLAHHAEALFGAPPAARRVRIMVTLPSEAANDKGLIESLVASGMDIARINCAHDDAAAWSAMVGSVRHAARSAGRTVRVLMDLGGPKLRTREIEGGLRVLKIKPERDELGRVTTPGRLMLRPAGFAGPMEGDAGQPVPRPGLGVSAGWLSHLRTGDRVTLKDARSARRSFTVALRSDDSAILETHKTVYLVESSRLSFERDGSKARESELSDFPLSTSQLQLNRGDRVRVVAVGPGHAARPARSGHRAQPVTIACTLPQVLPALRKGHRIWFDDGRIGGVVTRRGTKQVEVEITQARESGEKLAADKGINLPDTQLDLPALTDKDVEDLAVAAQLADMIGLSFAQSADDVRELHTRLVRLGSTQLGLVLKIETRRGFDNLPEMLLAAMACPSAGVMIARGDLAVECGYERMAEVQEEILWACEAAHMPVIWATQVLDSMARTGLPSRSEITDAAMGERAECVMLNKGPFIVDAMRMLDDILRRMESHQSKKRPLLRALRSWVTLAPAPAEK